MNLVLTMIGLALLIGLFGKRLSIGTYALFFGCGVVFSLFFSYMYFRW